MDLSIFKISDEVLLRGIVASFTWGFTRVALKKHLPIKSVILENIIAYFLAYYSQEVMINIFNKTDRFREEAENEEFLKTRGVELLKILDKRFI